MKILAVIVVYNCEINKSKTINSLLSVMTKKYRYILDNFKLIIYDNSEREQQIIIDFPFQYTYFHSNINGGVAKAYNYAFTKAKKECAEWLMLFDQDTLLNEDYFISMYNALVSLDNVKDIVACIPKILHENVFFSPAKVLWGEIHRPINYLFSGVSEKEIMAIGSSAVVRTSFIEEINGFNELFWLDYLDQWLFHTIYSRGKKVYVINTFIKHELSIFNFNNLMNEGRYENQLKYETIYMKLYTSRYEYVFFLLRLIRRSIILFLTANNKKYFTITIKHLINILRNKILMLVN
jgi:GT2 family glycosyltransferase